MDGPPVRAADESAFHASMLVAQRDLQVIHGLAVTLEAEMARFDNPRMDRADRHLVNFVARHLEEVRHAADGSAPGWCPLTRRGREEIGTAPRR
jgi:hypothetical protein